MHRPWGSYQSIDNGERHQVKHIVVKPGAALAAETSSSFRALDCGTRHGAGHRERTHQDRAREQIDLYPNRGCAPAGKSGKILLELIEVQTGSYLGEDDIIRIEDDYRRS